MSWQLGLMLFCGWLVVMYLILEFMSFTKRGGEDFDDAYQWKLRRKIQRDGERQRWGGR
jgi:predicted outer membrane lipoprotein